MSLSAATRPTSILYNEDGLRPGWSLLLYCALVALSFYLLAFLADPGRGGMTASYVARSETIGCVAFLAPALLMSLIERRPFSSYGLALTRGLPHLLTGLLTGLVSLAALIAVLSLTHHVVFEPHLLLHGPAILRRGLTWLLAFALVGLQEEFSTRGYLQSTLTRALTGLTRLLHPSCRHPEVLSFWIAAFLLSGLLFMALHLLNGGETRIGILAVALAGLTLAFSLWRTGSLWWAIGFHTTWDWTQSFLFGVADSGAVVANRLLISHPRGAPILSGGTTGPEGSLFVIPTLLLICITIHLLYPRKNVRHSERSN